MRLASRQVSFGDLELRTHPGAGVLKDISDVLAAAPDLVNMVHRDLVAGLKHPAMGREGMGSVQVLRAFVLQRIENLDLRALAARIADGVSWRVFTGFDAQTVPGHDAFNRSFNRLTSETVRQINEVVLRQAVALGFDDGSRLRVDTTVVETNIRFPTDGGLLWDSVRVITRDVRRLLAVVPKARPQFHDRSRSARRRHLEITRMTRQQREQQQVPRYKQLIDITEEVVISARSVLARARAKAKSIAFLQPTRALRIREIVARLDQYCDLADRVVSQTRRRVLDGLQVPVKDKVFSIFEPHTDLIVRGKTNKPVEFGHKVFLAESGAGLVTDYRVLDGNPTDDGHVGESLESHQRTFGRPPVLYAADRGFYSSLTVDACRSAGVDVECIPYRGGGRPADRQAYEKTKPFKNGQRFRAGIEGRISVLMRGRGMRRCLSTGQSRFEVFVGLAVLANNLLVLAELINAKRRRRKKAA